ERQGVVEAVEVEAGLLRHGAELRHRREDDSEDDGDDDAAEEGDPRWDQGRFPRGSLRQRRGEFRLRGVRRVTRWRGVRHGTGLARLIGTLLMRGLLVGAGALRVGALLVRILLVRSRALRVRALLVRALLVGIGLVGTGL